MDISKGMHHLSLQGENDQDAPSLTQASKPPRGKGKKKLQSVLATVNREHMSTKAFAAPLCPPQPPVVPENIDPVVKSLIEEIFAKEKESLQEAPAAAIDPRAPSLIPQQQVPKEHTAVRRSKRSYRSPTPKALPTPSDAYVQRASLPAVKAEQPRRLLIILDLNGTLLERKRSSTMILATRPYLHEFLDYCLTRHKLMIWSSAVPENVRGVCNKIFTPEQIKQLVAIWGRNTLGLSVTEYKEKVQVYKRLETVWNTSSIHKEENRWDQTNTILIDDSYLKAAAQPYNHIEVPEFKKAHGGRETGVEVLKRVKEYIDEAAQYRDVSAYIKSHKLKLPGTVESAGAATKLAVEQHEA